MHCFQAKRVLSAGSKRCAREVLDWGMLAFRRSTVTLATVCMGYVRGQLHSHLHLSQQR